jgi:Zn-dependent peptidase ImmA (M78 family)/predicted secreted protein
MADHATAIRRAALAAARLHRDLGIQAMATHNHGRVDVYHTIDQLGVPLMFAKLQGLLGAYYRDPTPGVLVTTERPLRQQRFTAAHELGHHYLGHDPSLDDENILRRAPFAAAAGDNLQEVEAESFAASFLLPRWLVSWHFERQGWIAADLLNPHNVYQLSLRVGTSFLATVWTLHRYNIFDYRSATRLAQLKLRTIKEQLLGDYEPADYRGDVWHLTERDAGLHVEGDHNDHFVVELGEQSGAGYLWAFEEADENVAVVRDGRTPMEDDSTGGPTTRRITAAIRSPGSGALRLTQRRPWQPKKPLQTFAIDYSLAGGQPAGWYWEQRVQHRQALEAA